jgi:hypothetical protein
VRGSTPISLDDFARRIDRIAVRVEGNVERAVKDCAQAVLKSAVENTPVDTGMARSNWTPELDRAFEGLFPARVPGAGGSTAADNAAAAIEAGAQTIEAFDIGKNGSIHITNNAPAAQRRPLEAGAGQLRADRGNGGAGDGEGRQDHRRVARETNTAIDLLADVDTFVLSRQKLAHSQCVSPFRYIATFQNRCRCRSPFMAFKVPVFMLVFMLERVSLSRTGRTCGWSRALTSSPVSRKHQLQWRCSPEDASKSLALLPSCLSLMGLPSVSRR